MKKCPYCGAENPDEAFECYIDKTPLPGSPPEMDLIDAAAHQKAAPIEIPRLLTVASYLFFAHGALLLALGLLILLVPDKSAILPLAEGLFLVFISRKLRKCSYAARICALVWLWLHFIGYGTMALVLFSPDGDSLRRNPLMIFKMDHITFSILTIVFVIQVWEYWILTQRKIRELF